MKKNFLQRRNHPRQRREYIDYDYSKKLTEEERDWLSKFTKEYYGADFQINDTYVNVEDLKQVVKDLIDRYVDDSERVTKYETYYENIRCFKNDTYLQVSGNPEKELNFDLRLIRSIDKFYEDKDGYLTTDTSFKYIDTIHDIEKHLTACNSNSIASGRDIICNGMKYDADNIVDNQLTEDTPENSNAIVFEEVLNEKKRLDN